MLAMKIFLYCDESDNTPLRKRLERHFGKTAIHQVEAKAICAGILASKKPDLLVFGGGMTQNFSKSLERKGNQAIRDYVHAGGCYLGICAGSYYAHATIDWLAGFAGAFEGFAEEEAALGLIEGAVARGPALIERDAPPACASGCVQVIDEEGVFHSAFYHAGPLSDLSACDPSNVAGVAFFTEMTEAPAIVEAYYGRGLVVASSPHIEYEEALLRQIVKNGRIVAPNGVSLQESAQAVLSRGLQNFCNNPKKMLRLSTILIEKVFERLETFVTLSKKETYGVRVADQLGTLPPFIHRQSTKLRRQTLPPELS